MYLVLVGLLVTQKDRFSIHSGEAGEAVHTDFIYK